MSNRILLADDSITIQKVVNLTFTDEGIDVVTVGNGELAIKKLGEERFDVVLADIFMPGRNGYEVCEYVKSSPEYAGVPVLLLVGAFEPFDKAEASRVQADGHLTKPFESRILIETVKRMLAEAAARRAAAAPPPAPEGGYHGHVVGWDVPTAPVVPQARPAEPSYDPYASTAQLPHLDVFPPDLADREDATIGMGSAAPGDDFFAPAGEAADEPVGFEPTAGAALEGPPDSVAGFSYADDSEPFAPVDAEVDSLETADPVLPVEEAAEVAGPAAAEAPIGYQPLHPTDSPLDLPDMGGVGSARAEYSNGRDPLLETFADVSASTLRVEASPDPELEANEHAAKPPSMRVGAVESVISAWDPEAQPPGGAPASEGGEGAGPGGAAEEAVEAGVESAPAVAEPISEARTMAFSLADAPFSLDAEVPAGASLIEPMDTLPMPLDPVDTPPLPLEPVDTPSMAVEPADTPALPLEPVDTPPLPLEPVGAEVAIEGPHARDAALASSAEAESIAADEGAAAGSEAATALLSTGAIAGMGLAAAEADTGPAAEASEAVGAAGASEAVGAAAPLNGTSHAASSIPPELVDEVVRRTIERMSDDVIREIAWEVVPELAERLIRKRLSEER